MQKKASSAANAARDAGSHGDHLLQGGHAIMKDDTEDLMGQDFTTSKGSESASKQSGLGGTKSGNLQGSAGSGAGSGDTMRQRNTQSHVGQTYVGIPLR
ncbi:hypothetical protein V8C42DRAFT_286262 [Trichoderma barbatum]